MSARLTGAHLFGACYAAGVAPGTALGATAALVLYNPPTNKQPIGVKKVSFGYLSGTIGAGSLVHCMDTNTAHAAPTGGNAVTGLCLSNDAAAPNGVATWGATVAAAPTVVRPFVSLTALTAAVANFPYLVVESVRDFILNPGMSYQIQGIAAAGTTPLILLGIEWWE
jgi:hypothetical protein